MLVEIPVGSSKKNFICFGLPVAVDVSVEIIEVGLNIIAGVTVVIANAVIGLTVTTATIF